MKRGRKSFDQLSKEQKDKLYETYLKKYNDRSNKIALTPKYDKQTFLWAYKRQYNKSKVNVIRTMVQSQSEFTQNQARTWSKNLKSNISKWKSMDPRDLSSEQKTLLNMLKDEKINEKTIRSKANEDFWEYMDQLDDWGIAVGS